MSPSCVTLRAVFAVLAAGAVAEAKKSKVHVTAYSDDTCSTKMFDEKYYISECEVITDDHYIYVTEADDVLTVKLYSDDSCSTLTEEVTTSCGSCVNTNYQVGGQDLYVLPDCRSVRGLAAASKAAQENPELFAAGTALTVAGAVGLFSMMRRRNGSRHASLASRDSRRVNIEARATGDGSYFDSGDGYQANRV